MKVRAATKAELVGRLSSRWQIGMFLEDDSSVIAPSTLIPAVQQQLMALPPFESRWQIGMFLEDDSSVNSTIHINPCSTAATNGSAAFRVTVADWNVFGR